MKKLFTLFAAALMAGSMMAEVGWIKFSEPQPATVVAGSTYGSNGFTLDIPTESDKASVDADNCTFGESAEETVSFSYRLKTGSAVASKAGRKFTLNIPEEGPLTIYARTGASSSTDRSFLIANGSDTIVYHVCLDTDTVEDASSKIFKPVIVENVPAGSYTITYNNGINFYGFQMGYDEPTAVDVTFDIEGFSYYRFQMNDSTWYLRWQGKEQSSTPHTLALYRTTNLANKFGHFTTADFDLTESYFNGDWVGDYVTEIDVTLTETEYGFTMSGYVVAGNGVTYNLAGEYAAPKATPSVTTFTTLSELDGLTITLSGVAVQFAGQDGAIYLTDESLDVLYGEGHNYTFSNNVLTIESFEYVAGEMDPLPEEGKDLLIYTGNVFAGYRDLLLCTIHYSTTPSALENTAAEVKAVKTIENGQIVIIREGKRYNAVGAQL